MLKKNSNDQKLYGYVFNTEKYMIGSLKNRINKLKVTKERRNLFLNSKVGKFPKEGLTPNNIEIKLLSLHGVIIKNLDVQLQYYTIISTKKFEDIELIRMKYHCDCKNYYQNGWFCAHIIATMSLQNEINLFLPYHTGRLARYEQTQELIVDKINFVNYCLCEE